MRAKLDVLDQVYAFYQDVSHKFTVACRIGCATCCTQDVTMTSLEGQKILDHLAGLDNVTFPSGDGQRIDPCRFKPTLTTNALAVRCLRGEDPPEEERSSGPCPCRFLQNSTCTIYEARPFGCRCFSSTVPCAERGYAVVEPFLLTINTVFLQCIEHIDSGGKFGNMNDVLAFVTSQTFPESTKPQSGPEGFPPLFGGATGLASNQPVPAFMVPPQHVEAIKPLLHELKRILALC